MFAPHTCFFRVQFTTPNSPAECGAHLDTNQFRRQQLFLARENGGCFLRAYLFKVSRGSSRGSDLNGARIAHKSRFGNIL